MTLRTFMFAADALRIEDQLEFAVPGAPAPQPSPQDVAARNAAAMQAFMGGMSGIKKGKR